MNLDIPPGIRALRDRLQQNALQQNAGHKPGLRVTNVAGSRTADVYLYDEIGYWGVTAQDFVLALNDVTATQITLHVNSPGGDVFDGVAIMNALRNHPATVDVRVEGLAASAASFIAMAGDSITVESAAQLMIHDAAGLCWGNAAEMTATAALLDRISDTIAGIYAARAGGTVEGWRTAMRAETWYSGAEAVAVGLADTIAGQATAEAEPDGDEEAAAGAAATAKAEALAAPANGWDLSAFTYAGRDAAPAPNLPSGNVAEPAEAQAACPGPDTASTTTEQPAEPETAADEAATTNDGEDTSPEADDDTWGALVAQLTPTAPLDVIGDVLASLREAMQ